MKDLVLFLDIDGVLTTPYTNWKEFENYTVENLKKLIKIFSPKIVIHSTWSLDASSRERFAKLWQSNKLCYPYEWATTEYEPDRKKRIFDYIAFNRVTKYIIIDDENWDFPSENFVHTTWYGLTDDKLDEAIELIKGK